MPAIIKQTIWDLLLHVGETKSADNWQQNHLFWSCSKFPLSRHLLKKGFDECMPYSWLALTCLLQKPSEARFGSEDWQLKWRDEIEAKWLKRIDCQQIEIMPPLHHNNWQIYRRGVHHWMWMWRGWWYDANLWHLPWENCAKVLIAHTFSRITMHTLIYDAPVLAGKKIATRRYNPAGVNTELLLCCVTSKGAPLRNENATGRKGPTCKIITLWRNHFEVDKRIYWSDLNNKTGTVVGT